MNNQSASTLTAKVAPLTLKRLLMRVVIHPLYPHRVVPSAAGVHDRSAFLTETAEDEDGCQGFGEGATTAGWSGETAETAKLLVEELLAPR